LHHAERPLILHQSFVQDIFLALLLPFFPVQVSAVVFPQENPGQSEETQCYFSSCHEIAPHAPLERGPEMMRGRCHGKENVEMRD
jgi:hypothetical protein